MPSPKRIHVIDLETTCWDDDEDRTGKPASEIIEIGITVIDMIKKTISQPHSIYVKNVETDISDYCSKLTGITPETLDVKGVTLAEASQILKDRYHAGHELWASWGFFDLLKLQEESERTKTDMPFKFNFWIPAKSIFYTKYPKKRYGLVTACKKAGLEFQGDLHRGSHDSWNTARLLMHCLDWPAVDFSREGAKCICSTIPQARRCTRQCPNHTVPTSLVRF